MKSIKLFAVLAALLVLISCKDPYGSCVKASADIGNTIAQGMKTVDAFRVEGVISVQEESNVLDYLEFANKADASFLSCVQTAHAGGAKAGTFTACAQGFNTALNNPQELALLHVSNPQGSANVSTIVNGITTAVGLILTGLGGK